MAFITYPLNNIDYTAEDAELFHCTRTSGIWAEDSFPISVTGADNNVTIGTGIAWINNEEFSGKVAALKSAEVLDLGIADGVYPRIDVIAIQYSANNNATDVVIKKGTPASNPVRPLIARTGAIYELYLASIYRPAGAIAITASNVTDLRMDETVCGLMADSVTNVDMTAIEAQIRSLINNLQNEIDEVKNLSGLMFETEWTEGGVIPVSKGGTGRTTNTSNSVLTGNGTNAVQNVASANGAFYANATNGAPKFGTLPIAQGGTGKTTAAEALAALGGISIKKLWQNASPTSDFAGQTLSLNLSEYDYVEIVFKSYKTISGEYISKFKVGSQGNLYTLTNIGVASAASYATYRSVTTNQSGITFGAGGFKYTSNNTWNLDNGYAIPVRIYGIKGVQ